ncbi:MAG: PilN domain-containing protein [Actinomycetota bacterium]|nr:PilN domain-containing protein [Actinomycetota bacterium]
MTASTSVQTLTRPALLPRVNLLPPEIAQRVRLRKLQGGMLAAVVVAVGIVAALYVGATTNKNTARQQLSVQQVEQSKLQGQVAQLQNVSAVYAQVAAREAMLRTAMGQEVQWSHYLNDLSLSMPNNVWLTSFSVAQTGSAGTTAAPAASAGAPDPGIGRVTVAGVGLAHPDVANWLESLAKEKGYSNPYFSNSTEGLIGTRKTVTFSSTVTVTKDALSGRYTQGAGK